MMNSKLKFAKFVAYVANLVERQLDDDEVERLDELTRNEEPLKAEPGAVNEILSAMFAGRKIDAIAAYRNLTGASLVSSKTAIEGYWPSHAS